LRGIETRTTRKISSWETGDSIMAVEDLQLHKNITKGPINPLTTTKWTSTDSKEEASSTTKSRSSTITEGEETRLENAL